MYLPTTADIGDDPRQDNDDARSEQARDLYWREFQDRTAHRAAKIGWPKVMWLMQRVMLHGADESHSLDLAIQDFAESEGWPNVLRALARAMEQSS